MFPVTHNNHCIIKGGVLFNDRLDVTDLRTGSINYFFAACFNFFPLGGGNAMRPDDEYSILFVDNFIYIIYRLDAATLEQFNCLGIGDLGAISINPAAGFMLSDLQNNVDCPSDAHAKTGGFGKFNFHWFSFSSAE